MWRTLPDLPHSLISAALHAASAVAFPCSRRRACPLVYTTTRYSDVVAMQVYLIDGAGQLSLSSNLKVKNSVSAAHTHSRPSAVVLALACRHAHTRPAHPLPRALRAPGTTGCCGGTLESMQRAPAKASSGSPQHHRSCISSLYRNTMLFDKLLP